MKKIRLLSTTIAIALFAGCSTVPTPSPTPSPTVTPSPKPSPTASPTPGNIYPLTMKPVATPGATVNLGIGPDTLTIQMANNPSSGTIDCSVALELDGVVIAAPLDVSSFSGMGLGQIFNIHGNFGPAPHTLTFLNGNASTVGLDALWINNASLNYLPFYFDGPSIDCRSAGAATAPNAVMAWDCIGYPFSMVSNLVAPSPTPSSSPTPAPSPVPTSTPDTITGALINGVATAPGTLSALVTATPANGTLLLPAGKFHGTAAVPVSMTISGAGEGKTIIDGTGIRPTYSKALFVPLVPGVTISGMTIQNAAISASLGANAAAVRDAGPGIGFTLSSVEVTSCQDGILTFPGNITILNSFFHADGASNAGGAYTHEMYLGGDTTNVATLTGTNVTCGLLATHAVKSRAGTTHITGGVFIGNPDDGTNGGSVIDIPDEGIVTISNATIKTGLNAGNHALFTFGEESAANAAIGKTVTMTGVSLVDQTGSGGIISSSDAKATLIISGSTYAGATPPSISGFGSVVGAFTPAK